MLGVEANTTVRPMTSAEAYANVKPIAVQMVANVLSVHSVDTAHQAFGLEVVIRAKTVGAATHTTKSGEKINLDNWEPRIRFLNMLGQTKWTMSKKALEDSELEFKWTVAGNFTEEFEMATFPADRQDLSLSISSAIPRFMIGPKAPEDIDERGTIFDRLDDMTRLEAQIGALDISKDALQEKSSELTKEREWLQQLLQKKVLIEVLRFERWPEKTSVVQSDNFCMSGIYGLSSLVRMRSTQTCASSSTTSTIRPVLVMSLSIRRHRAAAFWNVEMPMGLITALGAGIFVTPPDANDRLGVSVTLLLVAVSYKSIIAADIPRIAYLTMLDRYVMGCFFMLAVVVAENSICGFEQFLPYEHIFGGIWLVVLLAGFLVYTILSCRERSALDNEELRHTELAKETKTLARKSKEPQQGEIQVEMKTPLVGS